MKKNRCRQTELIVCINSGVVIYVGNGTCVI